MKIETKIMHTVDYGDFESLVNDPKTYGFKPSENEYYSNPAYSFVADIECGNDSDHEYESMTKKEAKEEFSDEFELERFNEWKNNNAKGQLWSARLILLDLVQRDLIPEGNYLIKVCW